MLPSSKIKYIVDTIKDANKILIFYTGDSSDGILTFDKDNDWGRMDQLDTLSAHMSLTEALINRDGKSTIPGDPLPKEIMPVLKKHIDELEKLTNFNRRDARIDREVLYRYMLDSFNVFKGHLEREYKKDSDDKCPMTELIKALKEMIDGK